MVDFHPTVTDSPISGTNRLLITLFKISLTNIRLNSKSFTLKKPFHL